MVAEAPYHTVSGVDRCKSVQIKGVQDGYEVLNTV